MTVASSFLARRRARVRRGRFRVIGRMTKAEKRALEDAPDMVLFIAQWIAESPRGNRSTDRITKDQ